MYMYTCIYMNSVFTMAGAWLTLEIKKEKAKTHCPVIEQPYMPPLAAIKVSNSPLTQKLSAVMREGVFNEIS